MSHPSDVAPLSTSFNLSRRQLAFGGAMIAAGTLASVLTPQAAGPPLSAGGIDHAIPSRFGPWRSKPASDLVLPPRDEMERRTYDQVLTRVYDHVDNGPAVMLLVAYGGGQTGLFTIHRPEACYPAQGYRLHDRAVVPVPLGNGKQIRGVYWSADSDVRPEQLLYWTRIGHYFPESWAEEHVAVIRNNLVGLLPDGVLVRMSVASTSRAVSLPRLEDFAQALIAAVGPPGRRIILGSDMVDHA